MKIILLKDVAHLGQKGDVKEVKEGFGRNFLLARGLARPATPEVLKEAERLKKEQGIKASVELSAFETALIKIKGLEIIIEANANDQGGLFRAISAKQILTALKKSGIEEIGEEDLRIKEPIKKTGKHEIEVSRGEIKEKIKIVVEAKGVKGNKEVKRTNG